MIDLPSTAVADRVSLVRTLEAGQRVTYAALEGPGCTRHIWVTAGRENLAGRGVLIGICFDDESEPYVEAPLGDLFGVMRGRTQRLGAPWGLRYNWGCGEHENGRGRPISSFH